MAAGTRLDSPQVHDWLLSLDALATQITVIYDMQST